MALTGAGGVHPEFEAWEFETIGTSLVRLSVDDWVSVLMDLVIDVERHRCWFNVSPTDP